MLALKIKNNEYFQVGDNIKVMVQRRGNEMYIAFDAPKEVSIVRQKVLERNLGITPDRDILNVTDL